MIGLNTKVYATFSQFRPHDSESSLAVARLETKQDVAFERFLTY